MSFGHPDLLWLIAALPILVGAGVLGYALRRRRVATLLGDGALVRRIAGTDLFAFPRRRFVLLVVAAGSLGFAAAGPRWGTYRVETERRSLDLVLALDVSKSMWARDLEPNRLERERLLARRLLRELAGDRIGMVAFAGRAYVLSPLTVDHGALELYLDALDPEIVSQGGSSLAAAIRQATDLVRRDGGIGADRAVVLVTDGEALEESSAVIDAAERAAAAGVVFFTVGLGTEAGAPIPDRDPGTGVSSGYKRDLSGEIVISKRDARLLETVAEITGGRYMPAENAGATDRLLADLRDLERAASTEDSEVQQRERYGWFVALALLLLVLDATLARGVAPWAHARPASAPRPGVAAAARGATAALAVAVGLGLGYGDIERGNRLYREGKYEEAVEAYQDALRSGASSPVLHYNLGTALLRLGRYEEAERHLQEALASVDPDTRERTHYNLGNRFLEAARGTDDIESRARLLDGAVEAYKHALRIQPADVDAKWNLELALREQDDLPPMQGGGTGDGSQQGQPQAGAGAGSARPRGTQGDGRSRNGADPGALTREQAERILSAVEQDERELFREKLREGRRGSPVARDW